MFLDYDSITAPHRSRATTAAPSLLPLGLTGRSSQLGSYTTPKGGGGAGGGSSVPQCGVTFVTRLR